MRSRSFIYTCAVLLAALVPTVAMAQADAAKAEAMRRYQEGIAAHEKGKEEEAYLKFSQAYVVVKAPRILFNLARAEQITGRLLDAVVHYKEYVAWPEHPHVTKATREKAGAFLSEVRARLGRILIDAPAGATIAVDGQELAGRSVDEPIDVMPGSHTIAARLGERSATVTVVAAAGVATRALLQFESPAPSVAPIPVAASSARPIAAPPAAAASDTASAAPSTIPPARTVVRWTSAGVALVGMGVGVGFAINANGKADDYASYRASHPNACAVVTNAACVEEQSLRDDHSRSATISVIGFVASAVGVAGAVYSWFVWPDMVVTPAVGRSTYGIDLQGRF